MLTLRNTARLRRRPLGRYRYTRLRWWVLVAVVDCVGTLVFAACRNLRALCRRAIAGRWITGRGSSPRPSPEGKGSELQPRAILLVQLDHLGDAIISTVMLPPLRQRYPKASIEVLCGEWNRGLFEAMPEVDRIHVSRINRFSRGRRLGWLLGILWWGWRLRARAVDLAIDVRGELPLALLLWLCGARRRVGWACGGGGFLLTDSPRYVPNRHEVESRLALLAELGISPPKGDPWGPAFPLPKQACTQADQWWEYVRQRSASAGPRIVVHVGAGTPAKQWPEEHWRELIGRMVVGLSAQVVLVGSRAERIIARRILGPEPCAGVADWTGQLDVVELAAVLKTADLFVGADSGPGHLAAAVGTPVVSLFSGTNCPRQWRPWGKHVRVLRHRVGCSPCHRQQCAVAGHPCMKGLLPERVAEVVARVASRWSREGVRS